MSPDSPLRQSSLPGLHFSLPHFISSLKHFGLRAQRWVIAYGGICSEKWELVICANAKQDWDLYPINEGSLCKTEQIGSLHNVCWSSWFQYFHQCWCHCLLKYVSAYVLYHPLIYDLSISLNNNRLMGKMMKPASFKQCSYSLTNEAADWWQETVCSTGTTLNVSRVASNLIFSFSFMTWSNQCNSDILSMKL